MLELQGLCWTIGWAGASRRHLQEVYALLPEVYLRYRLSLEWNCQSSRAQAVRTTGTIPLQFSSRIVSTVPLGPRGVGIWDSEREAAGTVTQEREMTETFLL